MSDAFIIIGKMHSTITRRGECDTLCVYHLTTTTSWRVYATRNALVDKEGMHASRVYYVWHRTTHHNNNVVSICSINNKQHYFY